MRVVIVVILLCGFYAECLSSSADKSENHGSPLFLTPYIEKGQIRDGQSAALVKPLYGNVTSFSGFLTVNKELNSNMFIWFFPAEVDSDKAPVVLWLQGGPGTSALYALFTQNGPYYIGPHRTVTSRKYRWTKNLNIIYIDNPIGTGFSFTGHQLGYSANEKSVGINLYEAVRQFFSLFPMYRKNDLYISGQSYGGKFAAILAHFIHENNKKIASPGLRINLKGLAIGNGFCDPVNMLNYATYLYQLGLVDDHGKEKLDMMKEEISSAINKQDDEAVLSKVLKFFLMYKNLIGVNNYYNILKENDESDDMYKDLQGLLNDKAFKKNIHVGNLTASSGILVKANLAFDIMNTVKPLLENLLENNYKILIYNGQLDVIAAYPLTVNYLKLLKWNGANEYSNAVRKFWHVDGRLAGYIKTVRNFSEVLVRDAGHMVPMDQPKWAFDLISRFTNT